MVILFLNVLQNLDKFETSTTVRSLIENKINSMLGDSHLDTDTHQRLLRTHSEIIKNTDNQATTYSLTRDKILITLFYDPLDKYSRDFYDDTETTDSELESLTDIENIISVSDGTKKPWNLFKNMIKNNQDYNPYFYNELIHIEEIKCSSKKMNECHLQDSELDTESGTNYSPEISTSNSIKSKQPPRNPNLVNKLPKIISSFYVPINKDEFEHIIVEYDGDYSLFNISNPLNIYSIIKYMKKTFDKHLEITDVDIEENLENETVRKMAYHLKNNFPDKISEEEITTDNLKKHFTLLNKKKKIIAPLYNDYYIYKCKYSPKYIKSKIKI